MLPQFIIRSAAASLIMSCDSDSSDEFLILSGLLYCHLKKKKKRRFWEHPLVKERLKTSLFYTLFLKEIQDDESKFFNFVRMSKNSFYELLDLIKGAITKQDTVMRRSITPEEKLVITLR